MRQRNFLIGVAIFLFVMITTFSVYFYQLFFTPNLQLKGEDTYLYIPEKATFATVLDSLEKNKILHDKMSFAFVARLLKYRDNIKPGRYLIRKKMANRAAILMLRNGIQAPMKLTFNNIRTKADFVERVGKTFAFGETNLLTLLDDAQKIGEYGFDTTNVMCMFIPDTYELYWNISSESFLKRMHKEYEKFWNAKRQDKAKALGLTPIQVAVLASIVQAETIKEDEKPRVAGVYLNRLKKDMLLQADPTLVFAWGDFSMKRVLNKHKEIASPYNTYKYKGLPPGPINIPAVSSIDAVLNHESHEYLFFCAREDFSGYHNFAKTNAEHEENARKYQKALNKRQIYN
ncbi:MAG TPA: endolytic transglycosylase MltG [Microscillaceae bacterium]|nr:endolytic transglycosylase MltG [Microscillaceae bacterium]